MKELRYSLVLGILALALISTGCATKQYVGSEVGAVHTRIDNVEGQIEDNQSRIREHDERISAHEAEITSASKTAQEALDRALEAGKLAEGKLLYETVLSDDQVRFALDRAELSDEAKAALDAFAAPLTAENRNYFIEIQGHTDSTGSEEHNHELGLARAEAARLYLNQNHQIPLHRMSVISYGESAPVADNGSREGRSQNRRVVLVVLK